MYTYNYGSGRCYDNETLNNLSTSKMKKFPTVNAQLFSLFILDIVVIIQMANERFVRAWRGGITIRQYDNGPRELNESFGAFLMGSRSGSGADDRGEIPYTLYIII